MTVKRSGWASRDVYRAALRSPGASGNWCSRPGFAKGGPDMCKHTNPETSGSPALPDASLALFRSKLEP